MFIEGKFDIYFCRGWRLVNKLSCCVVIRLEYMTEQSEESSACILRYKEIISAFDISRRQKETKCQQDKNSINISFRCQFYYCDTEN